MQIESLETRRMLSGLTLAFITANDYANAEEFRIVPDLANYSQLAGNFSQVYEPNADFNGDHVIDITDFYHFFETAVDSQANNLIRNSAGPGDSDCDGRIDKYDIRALGASFNSYGDWQNGDFTMNGRVTIQDFALAAANVLTK